MGAEYLSAVFLIDMEKQSLNYAKRRDKYLAAISREDLDLTTLQKYKIYEKHFHSGEPALIFVIQWIPTGYPPYTLAARNMKALSQRIQ